MAKINSSYIPYYIKSDAIAVFPCANRTNSYASRFTTEYNLTHLGLPNASWISKVAGKTTGANIAQGDKISCIINGYFFEFSLRDAYDIAGNQLPFEGGMTLTAYIDVSGPADPDSDPLKNQAQLRALVKVTEDQPTTLDKVSGDPNVGSLFLGLTILLPVAGSPAVSSNSLHSLQLATSGKYPYIGIMPQTPNSVLGDGAVTTAKIANNAVTADKIAADAITVDKIADNAVTAMKLNSGMFGREFQTTSGLVSQVTRAGDDLVVRISGKADEAATADKALQLQGTLTQDNLPGGIITTRMFYIDATAPRASKIMVDTGAGLVACTLVLDQATGTLTFRPDMPE